MNTESDNMPPPDIESNGESLAEVVFVDQLLQNLAAKLAAQFSNTEIQQDGTQPLIYGYEDPQLGHVEISDYYNRAHNDERVRSYLRQPNLDNQHLFLEGVDPIINFAVNGTQYAVFKPKDVDTSSGVGQLLTVALPHNLDPSETVVTKALNLLENPEEDPALLWLSKT